MLRIPECEIFEIEFKNENDEPVASAEWYRSRMHSDGWWELYPEEKSARRFVCSNDEKLFDYAIKKCGACFAVAHFKIFEEVKK